MSFSKDFSVNFLDRFDEGFYIYFEIVEKEIKLDKVLLLLQNNQNLSKLKLSFDHLRELKNLFVLSLSFTRGIWIINERWNRFVKEIRHFKALTCFELTPDTTSRVKDQSKVIFVIRKNLYSDFLLNKIVFGWHFNVF